jgi:hypothetical protein
MASFRPPVLDKAAPIVDPATGRITPYFQRFWQNLTFTAADGGSSSGSIAALQSQVASLEVEKVSKGTFQAWGTATGVADRSAFATYSAPTISNPPTQAEVQAIANHLQILSRHLKALMDDLK